MKLAAALIVLVQLSFSLAFASPLLMNKGKALQQCLQSCQALIGEPMYVVKQCVLSCQEKYGTNPRLMGCETYEEDCTRPGNGLDDDGEDDREQDNTEEFPIP